MTDNKIYTTEENYEFDDDSLYSFAFCGSSAGIESKFNFLAQKAEPEKWTLEPNRPNEVLRYYIFYTFRQCKKQNKIVYSDDRKWCCVNTGLLDIYKNDILMVFQENNNKGSGNSRDWYLKGFKTNIDRDYMDHFTETPKLATYTSNFEDYYFDPEKAIEVNYEHILDDNWERIHEEINIDKSIMKQLLVGIIQNSKKRIQRNSRLVVPQLYKNKIMYLLPIDVPVEGDNYITMALAVEQTPSKNYRANTIFTKDDAYKKARLLMKPEANWLIE